MKLLDKSTKITDPLSLTFNIKKSGWYLLIISARLKSRKQRGENETSDEDLTVRIDERVFPHPSSFGRLIDSPAAFSGGQLHNKLKTVYFITHLTSGDRTITLTPQYGAEVEEVSYGEIEFEDSKISLSLEKQAEKANGRSWITFVLDDLNLKSITAKATVDWRFPDGDDLKLIVDGKIRKNPRSIRHKNWIWASNISHKIFGGGAQEKTFPEDLPQGLHYIEFHADESPTLHYVNLDIGVSPPLRAKVVVEDANLRAGVLLSNQWISSETKDYISDVLAFRKEFQRGKRPVLLPVLLLLLLLSGVFLVRFNSPADHSRVLGDTIERSKTDEFANTEKSLIADLDGKGVAEEIVFVESGPTPVLSRVSSYLRQGDRLTFVDQVSGYFGKAQAIDLDEDGVKELVVEVVSGHLVNSIVYRYRHETLEYVPEIGSHLHGLFSENSAVIADINHSESKELILYSFWPPDEECKSIAKIYLYRHGQLVKYLDAVVAEEFCRLKPTFWGI